MDVLPRLRPRHVAQLRLLLRALELHEVGTRAEGLAALAREDGDAQRGRVVEPFQERFELPVVRVEEGVHLFGAAEGYEEDVLRDKGVCGSVLNFLSGCRFFYSRKRGWVWGPDWNGGGGVQGRDAVVPQFCNQAIDGLEDLNAALI